MLYDLKQSGRCWYQCLCEILIDLLSFSCTEPDICVFFLSQPSNLTIIAVYIDDCIVTATNVSLIAYIKAGV